MTTTCSINEAKLFITIAGERARYWTLREPTTGHEFQVGAPSFEIEGETVICELDQLQAAQPVSLANGSRDYTVRGTVLDHPHLSLSLTFRLSPNYPIVRFRYTLHSSKSVRLTKSMKADNVNYFTVMPQQSGTSRKFVSPNSNETIHSFTMTENDVLSSYFENELQLMGPMLVWTQGSVSTVVAYEHGSQYPDAYVAFQLRSDLAVEINAVKGNYYTGQIVDPEHDYTTIWFQAGAVAGDELALANTYRSYVLHAISQNRESRKPYLYYNTWAFQERNKSWNGKPYLDSMNLERILAEIDAAHRIGIEVFVIDTGWYEKTGDWRINRRRFPDELKQVKAKLDEFNMKLGLWFDPKAAAVSSEMLRRNERYMTTWDGKAGDPHSIWETEESATLCLVSEYADDFADGLIRLYEEIGVTYFKWDAIGQYGCNDPYHDHGNEDCTAEERDECYAFGLPLSLTRIVEKVSAACPEAIVDFDITEGYRCVGLSFLSAGKYFLINNGPYFPNLDIPKERDIQYDNLNVYFYPGPARGWVCRGPLPYDKWIPSVLFLTHYLPDDPRESQNINIGSLILGQNGIWGDLISISDEGIAHMARVLGRYKQVRDDITEASLIRSGVPGGNPEIYEKINPATGRGVVVAFANSFGQPWGRSHETRFQYVTRNAVSSNIQGAEGSAVKFDSQGRACIDFTFSQPDATILFFGE